MKLLLKAKRSLGQNFLIDRNIIKKIIKDDYIPIVTPMGLDEKNQAYNINADVAAGALATSLKSRRLLLMTDVEGVYEKNKKLCGIFLLLTALGGLTFVGMQAFEWSKLIHEGVRPWENPFGAPQFGAFFFMITGFHGTHVSIGVIFLFIFTRKVLRGDFDTGKKGYFTSMKSDYVAIEILGLYWHFVDLVWVFIFAFFYLW